MSCICPVLRLRMSYNSIVGYISFNPRGEIMDENKKVIEPKMGRPTEYQPRFAKIVRDIREDETDGRKTKTDIAKILHVARSTIDYWANKYPDFSEALEHNSEKLNDIIETTLFKKAIGYTEKETKTTTTLDVKTNKATRLQKEEFEKYYPPDMAAWKLWVNNFHKKLSTAERMELTGADGLPLNSVPIIVDFIKSGEEINETKDEEVE